MISAMQKTKTVLQIFFKKIINQGYHVIFQIWMQVRKIIVFPAIIGIFHSTTHTNTHKHSHVAEY